jgi:integrase
MKLTDIVARSTPLPAGKTDVIIFDNKQAGFGLRIRAGGKRMWICQYRFGAVQRRFNIGTIAEKTAAQAREEAANISARVRLGVDPQAERQAAHEKATDTLGEIGRRYLEAKKPGWAPGSYREFSRHIEMHWAPLARRSVHSISRADVAARVSEIAKGSGVVSANRARSTLSAMYAWAMREGVVDINPVLATNTAGVETARDRVLSSEELVEIWRACRDDDDYGCIVRLLILTGQRREEIGGIRGAEIDATKRVWSLPKERCKNKLAHDVPLSELAFTLLQNHSRIAGRDLYFGETENGPFQSWSWNRREMDKRIAAARKAAGNDTPFPPWVIHDVRRTVATGLAEDLAVQPHVIEAVLNHVSGSRRGVAGVYNRASYANEKRQALDMWASHIGALLADRPLNIVQMQLRG